MLNVFDNRDIYKSSESDEVIVYIAFGKNIIYKLPDTYDIIGYIRWKLRLFINLIVVGTLLDKIQTGSGLH